MAGIKEIGTGIIQLAYADENVLNNGYPFLRANIEKFNKDHPSLPEEMYNHRILLYRYTEYSLKEELFLMMCNL